MAKKAQIDAVRPVLEAMEKEVDKVEAFLDSLDKAADKGTDVIESGLEKVADVVPDALDTVVHASTESTRKVLGLFRNPKQAAVVILVASTMAGAALGVAGYFALKKKLELKLRKEYSLQLESDIAEIRRFYALRNKDGNFATPAGAVEELIPDEIKPVIMDYQGRNATTEPVKVEGAPVVHIGEELAAEDQAEILRRSGFTPKQIADVVGQDALDVSALRDKMQAGTPVEITESASHHIFLDGRPVEDFDYAAEVAKRDPDEPYVITHDEFMENENGWPQQSLTYYNGDDVLTDDQDMPIPDIEAIVDSGNLSKFGYGSLDKNTVYVRNEKLETDFEITLSQGEFSREVGGFNELKHSAPIRRFRGDDE